MFKMSVSVKTLLLSGASLIALAFVAPAYATTLSGITGRGTSATTSSGIPSGTPITGDIPSYQTPGAVKSTTDFSAALVAIQSQLTVQANARAAAQAAASTVPDGIAAGGLNPDSGVAQAGKANPVTTWIGAKTPTQTTSGGLTQVTIDQTQQNAILNWTTFNIGKNTTVQFNQQAADSTGAMVNQTNWVALNKVNDPSANPTQILGTIKAPGSVYIINQNGVIFGGTAQVNVHSLVAATANITNDQFLNNGIYSTKTDTLDYWKRVVSTTYAPSFTGALGDVVVAAGADIETAAPAVATSGGGFVMLLGHAVSNAGTIKTPKGQALLAAGDDFIIRSGYSADPTATTVSISSTRGNEVAPVLLAGSTAGKVVNSGLIYAQQGDITLTGHNVTQAGLAISTTSVNVRGTIHLLNSASDTTGSITLASGSLTDILPELDSTETATDSQRDALITASTTANTQRMINASLGLTLGQFDNLSPLADRLDQSRVEIVSGGTVVFKNGSQTIAQGGQVSVSAAGRIFAENGSVIDVSGVRDVALTVGDNVVLVNIQGNELRDSSANRDLKLLLNSNVYVDLRDLTFVAAGTGGYTSDRYYTSGGLLEVSGWLGTKGHTIGEWDAVGGTITLSAPQVIAQIGSVFNLSGGSLDYAGGYVNKSYVVGSDGMIYSVDNAPSYITYSGIYGGTTDSSDRWNVSTTNGNSIVAPEKVYEDGYVVGRDAGTLILSTSTAVFEGTINAGVVNGQYQTAARSATVTDSYKLGQSQVALPGSLILAPYSAIGRSITPYASDVVIGDFADFTATMKADDTLADALDNTVSFDAGQLSAESLGGISLASAKTITVSSDLTLADGGKLELIAPTIDVATNITARGGAVTLTNVFDKTTGTTSMSSVDGVYVTSGTIVTNPVELPADSGRAAIIVEPDVTIDTRGLWSNLLTDPNTDPSRAAFVNGGDVTIRSTGDVVFSSGALIDASSGAAILATGKTKGGQGGDITLTASYNTTSKVTYNGVRGYVGGNHGDLTFDGKVLSNGVTKGGALTLDTGGALVIGGVGYNQGATLAAGTAAPYDLTLTADLTIAAGTVLPLDAAVSVTTLPPGKALPSTVWSSMYSTGFKASSSSYAKTQAAWTNIPITMYYYTSCNGTSCTGTKTRVDAGGTIPAGVYIRSFEYSGSSTGMTGLNSKGRDFAFVIPADVFPDGVYLGASGASVWFSAGSVAPSGVTYAAGTVIQKGMVLTQAISVQPVQSLSLSADLFNSGFSSYSINGASSLTVASGTAITATMPVYRFTTASFAAATGSDPAKALELWTPPLYAENEAKATLTQRAGADITLSATSVTGLVTVAKGASVTVDPGLSITLEGGASVDVEGIVTAHGGTISLLQYYPDDPLTSNNPTDGKPIVVADSGTYGHSLWVGDSGVLDVSAVAYTATDLLGRTYGIVPDGGTIKFGRAASDYTENGIASAADDFIVIMPGAVLDASGTSATIDLDAGTALSDSDPVLQASDGGSITLNSYDGILAEGTLRAKAGGAGASGGTLHVMLETPNYVTDYNGNYTNTPNAYLVGRVLTIDSSVVPGALATGTDRTAAVLTPGQGGLSAALIAAGGFDTLYLGARNAIVFNGDVALNAGRSITLKTGALYDSAVAGKVSVKAPYVFLDGKDYASPPAYTAMPSALSASVAAMTGGRFSAEANLIDVRNTLASNFVDTSLTSAGDLRFLAATTTSAATLVTTNLSAPNGNLELTAEQLYPASGANVTVTAGYVTSGSTVSLLTGATLTIASVDGVTPDLPYSVFGTISFLAPSVRQGGIVRAPLGSITLGVAPALVTDPDTDVELLSGSITSVSAKGLVMPYGGTTDGVTYTVDGTTAMTINLLTGQYSSGNTTLRQGVTLAGTTVTGDKGSVIDLSGGGTLMGAAFVSGRGGSVDVLLEPLADANPTYKYSSGSDQVYAIVPGVVTAPVTGGYSAAWTGSTPTIGQQITIPDGVPGLPAGTYTLLPASYALLPGAFRIELGATSAAASRLPIVQATADGSYITTGYQGVANTAIRDSLRTVLIITPGTTVRSYSTYNEETYSAFQLAQATTFGTLRSLLPMDGKALTIDLGALASGTSSADALTFNGSADFAADASQTNDYDGSLILMTTSRTGSGSKINDLEITADNSSVLRTTTVSKVAASAINAIGAPNIYIGGAPIVLSGDTNVTLRAMRATDYAAVTVDTGAVLRGAQVMLTGTTVALQDGATINTVGGGVHAPDSTVTGSGYSNDSSKSLLVVSNGHIVLTQSSTFTPGAIVIGNEAGLYAAGSVGFLAKNGATFNGTPKIAAGELDLVAPSINIGSTAALAAATLPAGLNIDQAFLDMLFSGSATSGAKGIKTLSLTASNSIDFYGTTTLDFTGGGNNLGNLTFSTPAIYGAGSAGDAVTLEVNTLVWNGLLTKTGTDSSIGGDGATAYGSTTPGATIAGGPGTGSGTFIVNAKDIIFGYPTGVNPTNGSTATLDRLMLGFSTVTFNASDKIVADNLGTLSVYQSGSSPTSSYKAASYTGTGGSLNLVTPLLTGDAASILKIYAGGPVTVSLPSGVAASTATPSALGAEIDITSGGAVEIDTAVWLPTGKFTVTAAGDITLGADSRIDLAGQTVAMNDVDKYTWGGDVGFESTHGNISQASGSVIDISATGSDAGTLTLTATDASAGNVSLAGTIKASGGEGDDGGSLDLRAQTIGDPANLSADFAALNAVLDTDGFTESRSFDLKQGSLAIAAGQTVKAHDVSISIDGGSLAVNGTVDASGKSVGSITLAARDDLTVNGTLDAHGTVLKTGTDGTAIAADNVAKIDLTTKNGTLVLNAGSVFDLSTPDGVSYGKLTLNAPRTTETGGDIAINAAGPLTIRGANSIALNAFWTYTLPGGSIITQSTLNGYDTAAQAFMSNAYSGNALTSGLQSKLAGLTTYGSAFHLRPGVEIDSAGNLTVSGNIDLAGYRYGPNADRNTASATYGAGEPLDLVLRAGGNLTVTGSISDGYKAIAAQPGVAGGTVHAAGLDPSTLSDFTLQVQYFGTYYAVEAVEYITQDWVVPDLQFYRDYGVLAANGIRYYAGMTVPAGTKFDSDRIRLVPGVTTPAMATMYGIPAQAATSPAAAVLAAGTLSSSIRLVAGADLSAAATRTLTAQSALAGSGNLLLSNYHTTTNASGSTVPAASVLRTGTGDLDLLAGGNFSESSLYNISTNSSGAPADLTVDVQGNLTGQIYGQNGNTGTYSSLIANWLAGNKGTTAFYDGFTGLGALGGGKVTILVGGDAGEINAPVVNNSASTRTSTGLVVAATSGDVTLNIGGRLNPNGAVGLLANSVGPNLNGVFTALRGDLTVKAGAIGALAQYYGLSEVGDPRGGSAITEAAASVTPHGAVTAVVGDGATALLTRGDLALGEVGATVTKAYWTPQTSLSLFSAGGNLLPISDYAVLSAGAGYSGAANGYVAKDINGNQIGVMLPSMFSAVATGGSIYYSAQRYDGRSYTKGAADYVLMASPSGNLELLAMDSIYGAAYKELVRSVNMPARWVVLSDDTLTLHDGDEDPIRIYAVNGDIVDVTLGDTYQTTDHSQTIYAAAKAVRVMAGGDIVNFGRAGDYYQSNQDSTLNVAVPSLILNTNADDVSLIQAGGDIYYLNVNIAGPGTLEVTAGGNIYQGNQGSIVSIGPIATGDTRSGASILVTAGTGKSSPDYAALAALYLDPANQADLTIPLADQPSKVAKIYDSELIVWLKERFGYSAASTADALAYFEALPATQQAIFMSQVYFAELKAGAREYNDPDSKRYLSYLRSREAIATLFPSTATYSGDLIQFGKSGIRTLSGGDITILTPGGRQLIGVEGTVPPATSGVITQGKGNINLFANGSILLGLSRIMTTFGGNILAWSATGDINAGRGSKTTLVYTPPKRVYDAFGNVTLSPTVPSTGAGIATLDPIPEVPPGDIDLIAPLGTIDAGEAGIRVSGTFNVIAQQIVNAANIEVKGKSFGLPPTAVTNLNLTIASKASTDAATLTSAIAKQKPHSTIDVEVTGFGGDYQEPEVCLPSDTNACKKTH